VRSCRAFSIKTRHIAAAEGGSVKLWNADTGQPVFTLSNSVSTDRGVARNPDGLRLPAAVSEAVKLWDATPLTPALEGSCSSASRLERGTVWGTIR
jgi:WD40 repeat protein